MKQLSPNAIHHPSPVMLGVEPFRAALEYAWHHFSDAGVTNVGDGHPVVIFPGLGADGYSVATLRGRCRSLGYDAFDWGQGFNAGPQGDLDVWLSTLKAKVIGLLAGNEQPATFIGWSLGGLYARELAKLMAPKIRQVITIGTPFNSETDHTNVSGLLRLMSGQVSKMDPALRLRLRTPPPLRTTSIYSRSDGVVAWQTCRHIKRSRLVQDIEVEGSHFGMGWNREVLAVVADRLGQRPGPWRQYARAQ
ncbi:alpha/beta fold hydrolase [Hydrogenophaga sp.]|uniref:alpha/beta fold hydrolase n=1 Tax=Hydrogenophaga sp. TaxID=1904254 RepID=UPI00271E360A|nr:alpha/beta fold hydrolase [Hydrogenophaga sp.]MDO8904084.1 alpha/beta fold hydrolase [Hydrogenophaga sp.]